MTFTYLTGLIQSVTTSVSFDKHENEMNQQQVEFTGLFIYKQSAFDISKSKFNPNYWYFKVNFLIPGNLLWEISSLRYPKMNFIKI